MSKDTTELKSNTNGGNLKSFTISYWNWGFGNGPHFLEVTELDNKGITGLSKYLKFRFITNLYLSNPQVTQEMINAILSSPVRTLTINRGTFKTEVINSLQKLTELCIRDHKIPGHIIPQFKMRSLSLKRCQLGPEEAKLFLNMPWLKSLDLTNNPLLGDEGAKTLASLITLEELRLIGCNITPGGVKVFLNNKTLTTLDLSSNPIGYEGLLVLLSLSNLINLALKTCKIKIELSKSTRYTINQNLKTLDLRQNSLENQEMISLLTYCPALTQVDFGYMETSAIDLNTIVKFQNLKILKLNHIVLTDKNVLDLSNHPFITELSLIRCGLSPTGLDYLSKNPVLEKLDLSRNEKLQGDTINKYFSNFPALTHLILNHCSISDKAISSIAKNPRLQKLQFIKNPIILSWGIIALALNANINELTFDCNGIQDIYLFFFLGNRALDYLDMHGNHSEISDLLLERNSMQKKQQDKTEKDILSSCLPFPQVLIPIVQDYTREYSYSFQLFHNRLSEKGRRQWDSVLPEIEKNLPEITKFLK